MERREALRLSAALMGTGLSGMVFSGMLQGCKVDTRPDWVPVFFSPQQAEVIAEMAEHLLPATHTPGAKAVYVDRFLDTLLAECFDEASQTKFREGLEAFQEKCRKNSGQGFEAAGKEERDAIFSEEEQVAFEPARYLWGNKIKDEGEASFYRQFKGLVLFGYFSSEEVGKNVLAYEPIPGKFVGCLPLSEVGSSWAL